MYDLSFAERYHRTDFTIFHQKVNDMFKFEIIIMLINIRTHLDFFYFDDLLFLFSLFGPLGLIELIFSEIYDSTNWRDGCWCYLYQI